MDLKKFRKMVLFFMILLFVSCSKEKEQPVEIIENAAAFIRTLDFINSDLILDNMADSFGVNLEIDDEDNGRLLENVEVFARFKNSPNDAPNSSSQEVLVKTMGKEQFSTGPVGLPRILLKLSYAELVNATNVASLECGNQFLIRLKLNLNNGKSFSTGEGNSPAVIGFDTTISSPFCYTINIVNPIPDGHFTGFYMYESQTDGPLGPTFGAPKVIELKRGNSINDRYFEGDYVASRSNEPSRKFRFVFTCSEVLFRKNQITSFFTWCPEGNLAGGITFGGSPILLGPADETGIISSNDDSFFELSIAEGYEGWDGECGFGTVSTKVRFRKMDQ